MNENDKELLLKDICGRLPYDVKYQVQYGDSSIRTINKIIVCGEDTLIDGWEIDEIKLFLFPMSSMTDEQYKTYCE